MNKKIKTYLFWNYILASLDNEGHDSYDDCEIVMAYDENEAFCKYLRKRNIKFEDYEKRKDNVWEYKFYSANIECKEVVWL